MEFEEFITGYCRCLDAGRMVALEGSDGTWEADCAFGGCPYENECPVGQRIAEILESKGLGR